MMIVSVTATETRREIRRLPSRDRDATHVLSAIPSSPGAGSARRVLGGGRRVRPRRARRAGQAARAVRPDRTRGTRRRPRPARNSTRHGRSGRCISSSASQSGSAWVMRLHHCYADGIAMVRVLLSMTEQDSGPAMAGAHDPALTATGHDESAAPPPRARAGPAGQLGRVGCPDPRATSSRAHWPKAPACSRAACTASSIPNRQRRSRARRAAWWASSRGSSHCPTTLRRRARTLSGVKRVPGPSRSPAGGEDRGQGPRLHGQRRAHGDRCRRAGRAPAATPTTWTLRALPCARQCRSTCGRPRNR